MRNYMTGKYFGLFSDVHEYIQAKFQYKEARLLRD